MFFLVVLLMFLKYWEDVLIPMEELDMMFQDLQERFYQPKSMCFPLLAFVLNDSIFYFVRVQHTQHIVT